MENIIIPNPEEFERKKEAFRKGGTENLRVVSDFDRTLSKAFVSGKKSSTSFAQKRGGLPPTLYSGCFLPCKS